jgi:hypothetical protein
LKPVEQVRPFCFSVFSPYTHLSFRSQDGETLSSIHKRVMEDSKELDLVFWCAVTRQLLRAAGPVEHPDKKAKAERLDACAFLPPSLNIESLTCSFPTGWNAKSSKMSTASTRPRSFATGLCASFSYPLRFFFADSPFNRYRNKLWTKSPFVNSTQALTDEGASSP